MDDHTWRMRLAARRRRRRRERLFVLTLFVMAITAVFLYFSVYTKTPEFAMQEMVAAYRGATQTLSAATST